MNKALIVNATALLLSLFIAHSANAVTAYLADGSIVRCSDVKDYTQFTLTVVNKEESAGSIKIGSEVSKFAEYVESEGYVSFTISNSQGDRTEEVILEKGVLFYNGSPQEAYYDDYSNRKKRTLTCHLSES